MAIGAEIINPSEKITVVRELNSVVRKSPIKKSYEQFIKPNGKRYTL